MWQTLLNLNPFTKTGVILILLTINVVCFAYIRVSHDTLQKEEAMYAHPAVSHSVQVRREGGAVKIVERIVEVPGGTRTTERTITREPMVVTTARLSSSTPVAPAAANASSGRYLLGGSWRASLTDKKNGTIWAGYSAWNRIDLLAGVGLENTDQVRANVMLLTRWGS